MAVSERESQEPGAVGGFWRSLVGAGLDLLYPPLCRCCGEMIPAHDGRNICDLCWNRIEYIRDPTCHFCGAPLEGYLPADKKCRSCPPDELYFDRAATVTRYSGVMRDCIHLFKYRYKVGLKESLGGLMVQGLEERFYAERFDGVVPVPLHWIRRRRREFNQATLLAEPLAQRQDAPLLDRALTRKRYTRPQNRLTRFDTARQKNI